MTGIQKISTQKSISEQNLKKVLGYAVKNRRGYYDQLVKVDEKFGETIDKFKYAGFINTGRTLKSETYSITELGDEYYKEIYGAWNYLGKRISGIFERFVK